MSNQYRLMCPDAVSGLLAATLKIQQSNQHHLDCKPRHLADRSLLINGKLFFYRYSLKVSYYHFYFYRDSGSDIFYWPSDNLFFLLPRISLTTLPNYETIMRNSFFKLFPFYCTVRKWRAYHLAFYSMGQFPDFVFLSLYQQYVHQKDLEKII